jgi:uncharacterized membrane protein SpoIIM required for sporulation/ABC-type Na+ efflux pump permease subunit
MNTTHILAIVRREVREMLGDWRIVAPILLLTLVLPNLLVAAASQVVAYVGVEGLTARLVPFAALLVGFIPASFSLIAALESFAGERERNSLESLLAMPLSDAEIYLGKLVSSLFTPLLSSLVAMLVFIGLLLGFVPDLYFGAMDLPRFLLLLLLVAAMALVMVTGAVVVSSHITTVRAANLMSSAIMLPMAAVMQLAALLIINGMWPQLWLMAGTLALVAAVLLRTGMRTFSREELLSREHVQGQIRWGLGGVGMGRLLRSQFPTPQLIRSPIAIIARRELLEVLMDWRVLVPLFGMVFGLPLALAAGAGFALRFVPTPQVLGALVPFAALLVGFVPASFALITALESFVGERERNSLESLLAMPVSDRQLYLGKLAAALLVPLLGSLAAMALFLSLIRQLYPQLYAIGMVPGVLPQILLMIVVVTLLLVSGAVVISTHTSSVKAATLLASGVLVPTAVALQLQALLFIARRYDLLWLALAALAVIAAALIRSGMASFNREEILSHEHEDLSLGRVWATFRTFLNEYRPAGVRPAEYAGLPFSARRYYRSELAGLLGELRLPLAFALTAALAGLAAGVYVIATRDAVPARFVGQLVGRVPEASPLLALGIFANNIRVSVLSNLFSTFSFGIFAALVPLVAFAQVGGVAAALTRLGGSWTALGADSPLQFLLAYVAPHGVVELPAFILSAALGLRIGAALLSQPGGFTAGQNLLWALAQFVKTWLLVILPLVAVAAAIEGLVSPVVIGALYGG